MHRNGNLSLETSSSSTLRSVADRAIAVGEEAAEPLFRDEGGGLGDHLND